MSLITERAYPLQVHSIPGYPDVTASGATLKQYYSASLQYGHSMLCVSVSGSTMEQLALSLQLNYPQVLYGRSVNAMAMPSVVNSRHVGVPHWSPTIAEKYVNLVNLTVQTFTSKNEPIFLRQKRRDPEVVDFTSAGGKAFTLFVKNAQCVRGQGAESFFHHFPHPLHMHRTHTRTLALTHTRLVGVSRCLL